MVDRRQRYSSSVGADGRRIATLTTRTGPWTLNPGSNQNPYDAASFWGRGEDMAISNPGVNAGLISGGAVLRTRARDLYRQVGLAAGAVDSFVTELIGPGFSMLPATGDPVFDAEMSEILAEWEQECDADGTTNFDGLLALMETGAFVAGDTFCQFIDRPLSAKFTVPLQLRVLESEFCPYERTNFLDNGEREIMGVVFDRFMRRKAYQMYREHPEDYTGVQGARAQELVRVPADRMLHRFWLTRPGQVRGESRMTRAIVAMYGLDKYLDNEAVRKELVSKIGLIVTKPAGESGTAFDDLLAQQSGDDAADEVQYSEESDPTVELNPGVILSLNEGEEATVMQAADVGGSFEAYVRNAHRSIAKSLGVLYEHVSDDWTSGNDRLFRASLNHFQRRAQMVHYTQMVPQTVRPIYRRVVRTAVAAGVIKPPRGMSDRQMLKALYVPSEWAYIHPVQEETARRMRIETGVTDLEMEVAQRGDRLNDIDASQAADMERERAENAEKQGIHPALGRAAMFDNGADEFDPWGSRKAWTSKKFRL